MLTQVKDRLGGVLSPTQLLLVVFILLLWAYTLYEYLFYLRFPVHITEGSKVDDRVKNMTEEELKDFISEGIYSPGSQNAVVIAVPSLSGYTGTNEYALVPTDGNWWEYMMDESNKINDATFVERPISGLTLEEAILRNGNNGKICSSLTESEVLTFLCQRKINSNDAWKRTITIDPGILRAGRDSNDTFGQKGYFSEHTPDFHPMYVRCLHNMVNSAKLYSKPSWLASLGLDFRLPVNEQGDRIDIDGLCKTID